MWNGFRVLCDHLIFFSLECVVAWHVGRRWIAFDISMTKPTRPGALMNYCHCWPSPYANMYYWENHSSMHHQKWQRPWVTYKAAWSYEYALCRRHRSKLLQTRFRGDRIVVLSSWNGHVFCCQLRNDNRWCGLVWNAHQGCKTIASQYDECVYWLIAVTD